MTLRTKHLLGLFSALAVSGLASNAMAQEEGDAAPPPPAPTAPDATPPPEEEESSVDWLLFADAYASYNSNPVTQPYSSGPWHRAYAYRNGFSLSFLGLDATYDGGELGATGSLRYGPSTQIFFGADPENLGLFGLITQAYATWKPVDALTLDVGQFGTIYGAEVAESWQNLNYTRGGLYYGMQPFWHTGLRANYALSDEFGLTGLVVNGVNTQLDDNGSPSLGIQAAYGTDSFGIVGGYLGSMEPSTDGSGFDHFFDVVLTASLGDLSIVGNFDYNITVDGTVNANGEAENASFWGVSLAAGYQITEMFGVAARGEYLVDADNTLYGAVDDQGVPEDDVNVVTGTLTLDLKPVQGNNNLILRLDGRVEQSSADVFLDRDAEATDTWFQTVLGVVVTTDGG